MSHLRALGVFLTGLLILGWSVTPSMAQSQSRSDTLKEVSLATNAFTRGEAVPSWVDTLDILPAGNPTPPLVLRLADTHFRADNPAYFVHRAMQANASGALPELGQYQIYFNPEFQRVKLHKLRLLRAGATLDRLASTNIRFLQREEGLDQGVYSGLITANLLVEDVRVGDTLDIMYTVEGLNPVLGGKYVEAAGWDQGLPTELRRVTLLHNSARKVNWRFRGDTAAAQPQPIITTEQGIRRLRWEERGLVPPLPEPAVPPWFFVNRSLHFSEYQSWGEVADWAHGLFSRGAPLGGELGQLVAALRAKPSKEEQVAGALAWVQGEIRYFSLSLGESSHRPSQPSATLQRRYGDCKDKTFMLIELLRDLGIEAHPVLVSLRSRRGMARQLPSPYEFDHVVARVQLNGKSYFLDATRPPQTTPLDRMGQGLEGFDVLAVQPGNAEFSTVARPGGATPLIDSELQERVKLPRFDSDATLETRRTWSGNEAEFRRVLFTRLTAEQIEKLTIEPYERRYPGIRYVGKPEFVDDLANNLFTMTANFTVPKIATSYPQEWAVRYGTSNFVGLLGVPSSPNRSQPLAMPAYPVLAKYTFEIEFPPEVSVLTDPSTGAVRNKTFEYVINGSFRGNIAKSVHEFKSLSPEVPAKDVPAWMEDIRTLDKLVRPVMVVRKDELKSAGIFGLGKKTLQQTLQARLEDQVAKVTKSIESGRLEGEDLADAYCSRSNAYNDIGKLDEAMKDAQLAIKAGPNFAESYDCRASVYFALGDFARSIADYSKAITLDATRSRTYYYYRRGHARFYSGQLAAAVDDFAKAGAAAANDQDTVLYAELWRVWTQKRLGQTPDAAQRKLATADPRGDWPRPALAMLHGVLSVDEVLAAVEKKKGDDRELALVEAYFYIGQHYMLQGDKSTAINYFRKTREKGITMYVEHVSAGAELKLLGVGQ